MNQHQWMLFSSEIRRWKKETNIVVNLLFKRTWAILFMIKDYGEKTEMMLQWKLWWDNTSVHTPYKSRSIFKFGAHFFNSFAICFAFLRLAFLRCLRLFADSTFHILYNLISSYILEISEKIFFPQSFTLLAIHSLFFLYHFFFFFVIFKFFAFILQSRVWFIKTKSESIFI